MPQSHLASAVLARLMGEEKRGEGPGGSSTTRRAIIRRVRGRWRFWAHHLIDTRAAARTEPVYDDTHARCTRFLLADAAKGYL